ncbi:MAG: chorismate lyase [Halioglobus sp.]|nr:chorismate lyase [Halioglobus sp.]
MSDSPPSQTTVRHARRRVLSEPPWRPVCRHTTATLPSDTRRWLTDSGSLTEKLIASGRGTFSVRRLFQGWQAPLPSERILLALPQRQLSLVREVVLLLDSAPVVFARSIFPCASLAGDLSHLRHLQSRSLGAILFKHPGMRRHPFEIALMPGDSDYIPAAFHQEEPAWGRRCRFEVNGKKLMVSEVFLAPFRPWQGSRAAYRSQRGRAGAAIRATKQ